MDNEENELGSVCVASAFSGHDGRPVGAVSISGPRWRIHDDLVEIIGSELVRVCKSLSDALGSVEIIRGAALALPKILGGEGSLPGAVEPFDSAPGGDSR